MRSSVAIFGLRIASMASRFVLSFYLARSVGAAAVGLFGLLVAITAVVPVIAGLGIHYRMNREMTLMPIDEAMIMLKGRLAFTVILVSVTLPLVTLYVAQLGFAFVTIAPILGIVLIEAMAFELNLSLVNVRQPTAANTLTFIRSAAWIPLYVVAAALFPTHAYIMLPFFWLLGDIAMVVTIRPSLRTVDWPAVWKGPISLRDSIVRARSSGMIYLSDLGLVAASYVDRFVISGFLTIGQLGAYSFYWSLANAAQVLIQTSITQVMMPDLIAAHRDGGLAAWRKVVLKLLLRGTITYAVLAIGVIAASPLLLRFIHSPEIVQESRLLPWLFGVIGFRSIGDMLAMALYSASHDRAWLLTNMVSLFTSPACALAGVVASGLSGVVYGMAAAALLQIGIRLAFLSSSLIRTGR